MARRFDPILLWQIAVGLLLGGNRFLANADDMRGFESSMAGVYR